MKPKPFRSRFITAFIFVLGLALFLSFKSNLVSTAEPKPAAILAPSITASNDDALVVDADGDGVADPGDTIEYTVTINNGASVGAGNDATAMIFTDTLDANMTLVPGSVNASPVAGNDSYDTVGNTQLQVGSSQTVSPSIFVNGNVLSNDIDPGGAAPTAVAQTNAATTNGGTVTVQTNGTFVYTPPANFTGTDTFTYQATDGTLSGTGTVSVNVVGMVRYVKNDAPAGGDGRSNTPFNTLAAGQTATAGVTIYVFTGNGTTANQSTGITLANNQRLIGAGVALTMPGITVNGTANPTILAASTQPQITNTTAGGSGVSVGTSTGVEIQGLNIAGNTNAIDATFTGAVSGSLLIASNTVSGAGVEGIDINGGSSGTINVAVNNTSVTATGTGIDITRTAGTLGVRGFSNNSISGNTGGSGFVANSVVFDSDAATAGFQTVNAGNLPIGASGNGVGALGMNLAGITGDLNFTDLDIFADNGTALFVNSTGTFNAGAGTGFRIVTTANAATFVSTNGAAADITNATVDLQLSSLTSTNSATEGVELTSVAGTFSAPAGSSITNAANPDFLIQSSNPTVTYGGTITDDAGTLISISNQTGGTKSFTGAITDGDDGDGAGIVLNSNTGATITFAGGLTLSTGANPAFAATGGGTINVCDENPCNAGATGALVNKITTTTGTALNVANTTIGASGLEFRSISANGAANGIVLNNTGSTGGGLTVKGNGGTCNSAANCTGGAIQNTTNEGIVLTNAGNVSLTRMYIANTGFHGVNGTGMTDGSGGTKPTFAFLNGFMESPGDADNESALFFDTLSANNILGTMTVSDSTIQNFEDVGIHVGNISGNLTVNITNMLIKNNSDTNGEEGIDIESTGTAVINANVSNSRFEDLEGGGMNIFLSSGSGTIDMNIDNNVIIGTGGPDEFPTPPAMTFSAEGTASNLFFDITNNKILDNDRHVNTGIHDGIFIGHEGEIMGRITGNTIAGSQMADGIRIDTDATGNQTTTFLIQNNSLGAATTFESVNYQGLGDDGIQILDRDGTKTMNLTINSNQIANTVSEAIRHFADDDVAGGGPTNNLAITSNTLTNIGVADAIVIVSQDPGVEICANVSGNNLSGTANKNILFQQSLSAILRVPQANAGAVAAANTSATASFSGTITTGVTCNVPTPTNPLSSPVTKTDDFLSFSNISYRMPSELLASLEPIDKPSAKTGMISAETVAPAEIEPQIETAKTAAPERTSTFMADVSDLLNEIAGKLSSAISPTVYSQEKKEEIPVSVSGETITVGAPGGFTLPATKSVTIKFRAQINNVPGLAQVSNQGTVSGSNFPNVLTDDPSVGGGADPTVTLVDRTLVSVASSQNPSVVGQSVTFTATLTGTPAHASGNPSGTVEFFDGATSLGTAPAIAGATNTATAQISISTLTAGNHTITAQYSGGGQFNAASGSLTGNPQSVSNTAVWDGSASADWNTAANWTTDFAPTSANDVSIPSAGVTNNPTISAADITVNSLTEDTGRTLTINAGRTLTVTGACTVNGTLTVAGAFSCGTFGGTGTVNFTGAAAQNIPALSYQNLTINNSSGVNLAGDVTVGGVLTLTNGNINAGANNLILGGAATVSRTSGHVIGNVRKTYNAIGSFQFPVGTTNGFSPATVNVTAGTFPLNFTIRAVQGAHPSLGAGNNLQRYWTVTPSGGNPTANLTFNYLDPTDIVGTEANYKLVKISGGTPYVFSNLPNITINTAANTATITGITTFSDWTLADLVPNAANVSVGGRVLTSDGRAVSGAEIQITDANGQIRLARSNPFGYFRFDEVQAGETYLFSVRHKLFEFAPRVISVTEEITNVEFVALPE